MNQMINDRKVRSEITRQSHYLFFHFYLPHYVNYETAPFQREIFELTENDSVKLAIIVAFRSSGKSTIVTTSFPIWAILGKLQKKYIVIACQTKIQAKQHMMNLRQELESNKLLQNDLGPFQEEEGEWGTSSIVFTALKARITVVSTEQSVRGLRHYQHRPDLIIGDDLEDLQSVKTREGRDKTYNWVKSELLPAGDKNTKTILIGNLLHEDSLLMRMKSEIKEGHIEGEFRMYPLQTEDGEIVWPGKFPTPESIEQERKRIGDLVAWKREYLLQIVSGYDQLIFRKDIQYYDALPDKTQLQTIRVGMDVAISKNDTADYTALVTGRVYVLDHQKNEYKMYIDPQVINQRMNFNETVDTCKKLYSILSKENSTTFYVEDVGYQRALPEFLTENHIKSEAVKIGNQDKYTRLNFASYLIRSGKILFPRHGAEKLIEQLLGFGKEKYDDMVDALTILALDLINNPPPYMGIIIIATGSNMRDDGESPWRPITMNTKF